MDKQQKSDAYCARSTSSSSRRVMWKMDTDDKDEEVFDSVVTYRWMPAEVTVSTKKSKSNPEVAGRQEVAKKNWRMMVTDLVKRKDLTQQEQPTTSPAVVPKANSLAKLEGLDGKERAKAYWLHLEDEDEKDIPLSGSSSLALRYKPSHESLKYKRSKDRGLDQDQQQPSTSHATAASLNVETCDLPPHQTCVVREPPPMFAHRVRISMANDTDSCSSGEVEARINGTASDASSVTGLSKHLLSVVLTTPACSSCTSDPQVEPRRSGRARSLSVSGRKLIIPSNSVTAAGSPSEPARKLTIARHSVKTGGSPPESAKKLTIPSNSGTAGGVPSESGNLLTSSSVSAKARSTSESGKNSNTTGSVVPNLRQRQQELHHYRVLVEKRRLDLLELKIAREREETLHQDILFHKDLQIKENLLKTYDDNDVSHA
ncbi:uncharacterized protein LOC117586697 [Drosophila guanche]|uniref:Uncharacterized protein n=1 Tax=Drosophila guanche TaxID=7266 RepID=A0A3B0KED8_DROGU|nr:uncharacterized protein LOC117586697 [Drosophila guanche]SPP84046.1 Hypothetical predicted protein [Drosophila guanche]